MYAYLIPAVSMNHGSTPVCDLECVRFSYLNNCRSIQIILSVQLAVYIHRDLRRILRSS